MSSDKTIKLLIEIIKTKHKDEYDMFCQCYLDTWHQGDMVLAKLTDADIDNTLNNEYIQYLINKKIDKPSI